MAAGCEGTALEAQLKAHKPPSILHLATHGFFLPDQQRNPEKIAGPPGTRGAGLENPLLRSGLALAGANTAPPQGPVPAEAGGGLFTAEDGESNGPPNNTPTITSPPQTQLTPITTA